jgi:3-isopropylmalate dehydratase small subunit
MKFDVKWHENCLKNQRSHVAHLRQEVERMMKDVERQEAEVAFYDLQVETAKTQKKDGFDREKFLKDKKKEIMGDFYD